MLFVEEFQLSRKEMRKQLAWQVICRQFVMNFLTYKKGKL